MTKKTTSEKHAASDNEVPFEVRLKELEDITQRLRSGTLPLDEAIRMFEKGVQIASDLEDRLKRYEMRVEKLLTPPSKPEEPPEMGLFEA